MCHPILIKMLNTAPVLNILHYRPVYLVIFIFVYLCSLNKGEVRKEGSVAKKIIVLSLLVIYLLIAITYIVYLPKYNPLRTANNFIRTKTSPVVRPDHAAKHNTATLFVLLHRVYKSTIENKRVTLHSVSKAALTTLSLAFSGVVFACFFQSRGGYGNIFFYRHRQVYLTCRSIRI